MRNIIILVILMVCMLSVNACRTFDPIKQAGPVFAVPVCKEFASLFYLANRESMMQDLVSMIDLETRENFNEQAMLELMDRRDIMHGKEKFELEVIQEISPQEDFRFIYLLKKEDFGLFSRNFRSLRLERLVSVKRGQEWFIYLPDKESISGFGIDTIYQEKVKDFLDREDNDSFLKTIVDRDYETARLLLLSRKFPDLARDDIIQELMTEGIRFYDNEQYREALRLFKKAFNISNGSSQKAATYMKRCQKAIEMGL